MASCQLEFKGKLMGEVKVKSSSIALFHLFVTHPHQFANFCPSIIQSCRVVHGEFGKNGSVIAWNYNSGGNFLVAKVKLENLDLANKSVTYRCVEGDVLNVYKTFLVHLHVMAPQPNNCNLVQWTVEYEMLNEGVGQPKDMLNTLVEMTKQAEAHLI